MMNDNVDTALAAAGERLKDVIRRSRSGERADIVGALRDYLETAGFAVDDAADEEGAEHAE